MKDDPVTFATRNRQKESELGTQSQPKRRPGEDDRLLPHHRPQAIPQTHRPHRPQIARVMTAPRAPAAWGSPHHSAAGFAPRTSEVSLLDDGTALMVTMG